MIKFNFLLFLRFFKKYKTSFFLNVLGLAAGLSCAIFISLWIKDEMSVDKFHENDDRLYQVMENQKFDGKIHTIDITPGLLPEAIASEMPEIAYAVAYCRPSDHDNAILINNNSKIKATGNLVSKDFFNVFSFELLSGNIDQVFNHNESIVITDELSMKLFNTLDVVGQTIEGEFGKNKKIVSVSGVVKKPPLNSSLQFEYLQSLEGYKSTSLDDFDWGNRILSSYLVLKDQTDVTQLNTKISKFLAAKGEDNESVELFLKKFSDNYLYSKYENGVEAGGRIEYVKLFFLIIILVLMIAAINFMNLSTAKASRRLKEIGVKKAVGANRSSLIIQFFGESILMCLLSLFLSFLIVLEFLPGFNEITGKQFSIFHLLDLQLILIILGVTLLTALMAGSYPAFYLSDLKPIEILKGKFKSGKRQFWIRKGLVTFQFMISILLIVFVWIVYKQIDFVQNKNLGYDKDQILYFRPEGKVLNNVETFLTEVKNVSGVLNASSMDRLIVHSGGSTGALYWPGKTEDLSFEAVSVNYDLIETLSLEMISGRAFSKEFGRDTTASIIFNEAAIKAMGLEDPLGVNIQLWEAENYMEIIGVVKDFHFESLHKNIKPMFLELDPEYADFVMIKAKNEKSVIDDLKQFHASFNPGYVFDYKFMDESYNKLYTSEIRVSILSRYFGGLTILISCLGLLGLAAFTAERRLKEIGVRKTLGASSFNIMTLLSIEFLKIILVANLVALPISYFLVKNWLNNFAFKIELQWWFFVGAGFLTLAIALITISLQIIKVAKLNPVYCLQDE